MLVRGDEYYMAVCNQTGTIAVYNESKNIFLSPMIDGPLKYVGNLENEKNIIQKSRFGRDFSIVRVPYAFKLLMQELKTMNVQMRIITENNVDKMTSLYKGESKTISGYKDKAKRIKEKSYESVRESFKADMPQKVSEESVIVGESLPKTPDSKDYPRDEYPELYKDRDSLDDIEVYDDGDKEAENAAVLKLSSELIVDGVVKIKTPKGITKHNFKILEINKEDNEVILLRLEPFEEIINVKRENIVLASGEGPDGNMEDTDGNMEDGGEDIDEEYEEDGEEEIEVYTGKSEKEIRQDMQDLAEEASIGADVKIMTNRGVSKDNFEIMGQSTSTKEFTLRNKETGMITTRPVREILVKESSLKDPNTLDIGDNINLQVDEMPRLSVVPEMSEEAFEGDVDDMAIPITLNSQIEQEEKKDIHEERVIKPDSNMSNELQLLSVDSTDDIDVIDLNKKDEDNSDSKLKQIS